MRSGSLQAGDLWLRTRLDQARVAWQLAQPPLQPAAKHSNAYESSFFACLGLASVGSSTVSDRKGFIMGAENKAANKVTETKGKIKKKAGQATDDTGLEAEGRAEEAKGNLKQAGEKVKDAFKK
jgi:uncharacterized protein YjbJ (UPF0337 family)